jgi:hypothetical protein
MAKHFELQIYKNHASIVCKNNTLCKATFFYLWIEIKFKK